MAALEQPPPEGSKPLSGLLGGIAQAAYYGNADITEELLRGQLYPEAAPEEFRALRAKMGGLLQVAARTGLWRGKRLSCGGPARGLKPFHRPPHLSVSGVRTRTSAFLPWRLRGLLRGWTRLLSARG